jgi:16S rRNA (guanine1516-N2)-methyltransferase
VTTSGQPKLCMIERAQQLANRLQLPYVERAGKSMQSIRMQLDATDLIVISADKLEWLREGEPPLFFHPGMSYIRAKRLAQGEADPLLQAAEFIAGDSVLDCTAGMASDAIIFSYAGGSASHVVALESELPLYLTVSEGLKAYASSSELFNQAMRRIHMLHSSHLTYLRTLADRSVDIIYFDPMFRLPVAASSGIRPLRSFAEDGAIQDEAIVEALRVARKRVIMKERHGSEQFARFGFEVRARKGATTTYGVIHLVNS